MSSCTIDVTMADVWYDSGFATAKTTAETIPMNSYVVYLFIVWFYSFSFIDMRRHFDESNIYQYLPVSYMIGKIDRM